MAPGQSHERFAAELRACIGDEVEIAIEQYTPPLEAAADTELFRTIAAVMARREPHTCLVQWTGGVMSWRPSLESIKMLEVINAGR